MPIKTTNPAQENQDFHELSDLILQFVLNFNQTWTPSSSNGWAQKEPDSTEFGILSQESTIIHYQGVFEDNRPVDGIKYRYLIASFKVRSPRRLRIYVRGVQYYEAIDRLAVALDEHFSNLSIEIIQNHARDLEERGPANTVNYTTAYSRPE